MKIKSKRNSITKKRKSARKYHSRKLFRKYFVDGDVFKIDPEHRECRVATVEDIFNINEFHRELFPDSKAYSIKFYAERIKENLSYVIYEKNETKEKLIAFIMAKKSKTDPDNYYISLVGVLPEYQKKGIFNFLLGILINIVKEKNGYITLDVYKTNADAIKIYKKKGFEIINEKLAKNGIQCEMTLEFKSKSPSPSKRKSASPSKKS